MPRTSRVELLEFPSMGVRIHIAMFFELLGVALGNSSLYNGIWAKQHTTRGVRNAEG